MKKAEISEYLPEEVIIQILSRLPVKSILKFTCVCKLWNSIIRTPDFISTFSSNKHENYIFLLHSSKFNYQFSMHFDNKDFDDYLSLQPLFNQANVCEVVGSSNGLICLFCAYENPISFRFDVYKFVVWNPSIRKFLLLPEPSPPLLGSTCLSINSKLIGFGYDARFSDYKLFVAQHSNSVMNVNIYSLNSNTWKTIANVSHSSRNHIYCLCSSTFIDGRFYWHPYEISRKLVLVFDLRDEMFGEIILPAKCLEGVPFRDYQIKAFGESSIAVIIQTDFFECEIWVMQEYGVGEWTKLATVGKRWRGSINVTEFRDNGEILVFFCRGQRLASYNLNGRIKNILSLGSESRRSTTPFACRYVESLALLDKGNDVSNELLISFMGHEPHGS